MATEVLAGSRVAAIGASAVAWQPSSLQVQGPLQG
eukprot:CAMPEP_0173455562 /NCGR_PEP_ID=MMETSP1357-20121228/54480_1 /TAXON_ID=77926 /ORGANISM="Hemiselmis rufescens, Strain PCC563" /LENGTH=34 /DNA_ID= /DNA_START= /DNA_END= /DNA_ORIENTATION=